MPLLALCSVTTPSPRPGTSSISVRKFETSPPCLKICSPANDSTRHPIAADDPRFCVGTEDVCNASIPAGESKRTPSREPSERCSESQRAISDADELRNAAACASKRYGASNGTGQPNHQRCPCERPGTTGAAALARTDCSTDLSPRPESRSRPA